MPLAVRDLTREADLGLRVCTTAAGLDRIVRWVAVTELGDPSPWMSGGELILTTGLRQRTAAAQAAFVQRVAAAGASGIVSKVMGDFMGKTGMSGLSNQFLLH